MAQRWLVGVGVGVWVEVGVAVGVPAVCIGEAVGVGVADEEEEKELFRSRLLMRSLTDLGCLGEGALPGLAASSSGGATARDCSTW